VRASSVAGVAQRGSGRCPRPAREPRRAYSGRGACVGGQGEGDVSVADEQAGPYAVLPEPVRLEQTSTAAQAGPEPDTEKFRNPVDDIPAYGG
jgi:hypothetical protein